MEVTSKDKGVWSFRIDHRGIRVPVKFIPTGKTWTRKCPKCGFKSSSDVPNGIKL